MTFKNYRFKSQKDAMNRAKKYHACLDCSYNQPQTYENCPECGSTNRQYFMSYAELMRGMKLLTLQRGGTISKLRFQPAFDLSVNGIKIGKYVADFDYYRNGAYIVEDVKGSVDHIDALSTWKMKHFRAQYSQEVSLYAD